MKLLTTATAALLLVCSASYAQNIPQEEENAAEILYQKVKKPVMAIPQGPDGDDADKAPVRARMKKVTATRAAIRPTQQLLFTEKDAPGIAMLTRAGLCAAPVIDEALEPVYNAVKAHMPMFLPYKNSTTGIWQGFYYSWDNNDDGHNDHHGAIDYGKTSVAANEDPTFGVYAIAPGKVLDVFWANGGGNIIEIEHTAPDGFKYRSKYLHLRNGYDNDRTNAQNTSGKYKTFATSGSTSKLCWGTNSQKIAVKKNDIVQGGQFLAYAGNTGSGGIGVILKDDGTLKDANTRSFNVHLHFEVRVQDTRAGHSGEWVLVDPYGAYNHGGVDCYDLEATTPFARLFAPFYPSFHNVPLDVVNKFWGYYTGMGMALQTVSVDRSGSNLYTAGSFQWGLPGAWYARFYMTGNTYQSYFTSYDKQGFRPRQLSITKDASGNPRFTAIWEKKPAGQAAVSVHNRDDANFGNVWKDYVTTKKWHVQEHVDYVVNGKRLHAAVFVNKPNDNGFYMYYGMNGADFDKKFKELYDKWELKSINVSGNTVGGVWRPKKNNYAAYYGLTSSGYQTKFNQLSAEGLRLIKVQNYDGNGRFSAIWGK